MVEHGARVTGRQLIGAREARHDRHFAGDRHTVIALAIDVDEAVIRAMQMEGVRHVVAVLKRNAHLIALLDADRRRRQAKRRSRALRLEIFHGHADKFRREHPQTGLNARRDVILGDRIRRHRRTAIQFRDFQTNVDFIRVTIAIKVTPFYDGVASQFAGEQSFVADIVGAFHECRHRERIVRNACRGQGYVHAIDRSCIPPT